MTITPAPPLFDSLIIGDGIAGLSTAASLVRTLHTAVVFTTGTHRNDTAPHITTIPSWDSHNPCKFRQDTQLNILTKYSTVQFADVALERVEKIAGENAEWEGLFRVTDVQGRQWLGKTVVLAMGVRDVFPNDVPGYESCWVTGILHCLVHRGYEERGCSSAGILSIDTDAVLFAAQHLAFQARNLTTTVTIYTHGNASLTAEVSAALTPLGFRVDGRRIKELAKGPEGTQVNIQFEDGKVKTEGFLVHRPRTKLNGPFAAQLGVEMAEQGHIRARFPFNETSVKGCYVAGDAGSPFKIGTQAVVMGSFAAGGVQAQVNMGNWGMTVSGGEEGLAKAEGEKRVVSESGRKEEEEELLARHEADPLKEEMMNGAREKVKAVVNDH